MATNISASSTLIKRLCLYDVETFHLLVQAHELAKSEDDIHKRKQEDEIGNNRQPVLPATTNPHHFQTYGGEESSDDDLHDNTGPNDDDDDQSESEESDSSSVQSGDPLATIAENGDETTPHQPLSRNGANISSSKVPKSTTKQPSSRQQKRKAQLVKHHSNNLQRITYVLPNQKETCNSDTTNREAAATGLLVPASILNKGDLQMSSKSAQTSTLIELSRSLQEPRGYVVVLLLQSGRFSGGVFQQNKCVVHRALQQYTVRKGQGKAQSSQDQKRRPKSVGSQLRRSGEQALKEDVRETLEQWKGYICDAVLIFIACPKTSRATIFGTNEEASTASRDGAATFLLSKDDNRIRKVSFDAGRPTYENVKVVHEVMMDVEVRLISSLTTVSDDLSKEKLVESTAVAASADAVVNEQATAIEQRKKLVIDLPLTPLHEACREGNLTILLDLLRQIEPGTNEIIQPAGYDCMTPLHFAAESTSAVDPVTSAACITALLIQAHASPTILDARGRPPYFLASHDKVREAFRKARAVLGEEFCDWDGEAKVGPPLTEEEFAFRKEKEAEKKRRKKARQKEKKEKEKAQSQEMEERRKAEEEAQRQAEEAKRLRDGLSPKVFGGNVCDYCQKVCKGKKRSQMFERLEYKYCSTDCVNSHKREILAAAAMSRFNGRS